MLFDLKGKDGGTLAINQLECINKHVESIISNLDEYSLKEIFSGYEKDVNKILQILHEETANALFTTKGPIKTNSFDYLDKLSTQFDSELKDRSFNYFVQSVLPNFEIEPYHIEWGNLIQFYKWLCVIAARGHSKSFTFSYAYPIWKMWKYKKASFGVNNAINNLNRRGMIITNEHSLAKEFLKFIKEEIEQNPILRERLYSPNNWGMEQITTKLGAELQVKGAGSSLRGRHPGWIVLDDLPDESNFYSQTQRELTIDLVHSTIMNMILSNGQVIMVGTPYHQNDIYENLKRAKSWRVYQYPAIYPDGTLLSTRFSLPQLLEKRKSQGSLIFSREILCKPVTSDSSIFPWEIIERCFVGMDKFTLVENIYSHPIKFKKVVLGCDFAISANVKADWSVFVTVGLDDMDNYWVLNITRLHGSSYNEQISKIAELKRNFKYNCIMGENNSYQEVMIQAAKGAGIDMIGHTTTTNKYSLQVGLPALSTIMEQNKLKLPRGDEKSINLTNILANQANGVTFKPTSSGKPSLTSTMDHDDDLMGLWIAIRAVQYVSKSFNFGFL